MNRLALLVLLATLPAVVGAALGGAVPDAFVPRLATLDSARAEIEVGRHWHASRILRRLREDADFGPDETLLLARAEAGYYNWRAVVELLDDAPWLEASDDGAGAAVAPRHRVGLWWLGRSREELGEWEGAVEAYTRYLRHLDVGDAGASPSGPDATVVRVRLARVYGRSGAVGMAAATLDSLTPDLAHLGDWVALELAAPLLAAGDTQWVRRLSARARPEVVGERGWDLVPRARLAAGDSAGAEAGFRSAAEGMESAVRRARAHAEVADLALARGDTVAAADAYAAAFTLAPRSSGGTDAAGALLALGRLPVDEALVAAGALGRAGRVVAALEAFDLHLRDGGEPLTPWQRLERARLLGLTRDRRDDAVEEHRALQEIGSSELGARNLELWADLRGRQGLDRHVATLRRWMVERYPTSRQAGEIVFGRGDRAQDRGDVMGAEEAYRWLEENTPTLNVAGLARMRLAQIRLGRGRADEALEVFLGYLDDFPEGRRWDEASYWAGRILLESDRADEARPLLEGIAERDPFSYYAVQAAELLGRPYTLPFSDGAGRSDPGPAPPSPRWLEAGLRDLDLLEAAGLGEGRQAAIGRLTDRARDGSDEELLATATALVERDLPIEAINLGWALRERGRPWSRPLLRVVYPFPYREMVEREARERGLDPMLVAALIRQESAFDRDIVSRAGAVGLMQVMPPTGRQLARTEGPADFSIASLETAEVNLHLGTRFFVDMLERYGRDLPLVLSAYNAGPTRANRWRRFPEAADPLRFTERIPFSETRDYVKKVTRNAAVYRALYGEG